VYVRNFCGKSWALLAAAIAAAASGGTAHAQTIQFPQTPPSGSLPPTGNIYSPPARSAPAFTSPPAAASPYSNSLGTAVPPGNLLTPPGGYSPQPVTPAVPFNVAPPASTAPITPLPGTAPGPVGTPVPFDPYSTSPYGGGSFWPSGSSIFGTPSVGQPTVTTPGGGWTAPGGAAAVGPPGSSPFVPPTSPFVTPSPGTLNPQPYVGSPYAVPGPAATQTPGSIYPNGIWSTNPGGQPYYNWDNAVRLLQDLRLRHTYLVGGDDPTDLGINDTEVAVTLTIPQFLWSQQPLYISPAFALHLWDGPIGPPFDLPPSAYSAYLDFQWASDPNLQYGVELGFRVGVYTDFDTFNTDSFRIQGLGLFRARLTPTLTFKIGAMYLDRNKIKILPAGGFVWQPSSQVRFDILFPNPKLTQYITTVGTSELWWYVAGEYGGGAWTIERADGSSDRIDINDIRVALGLEWMNQQGISGFVEAGIVFEREVIYVVDPSDSVSPDETFMIRAGISF
jgi:hypothetical protein